MRESRKGFTMIEMLILIAVIALLAMIVIPHLGPGREAQEETMLNDLHALRNAVQQFEADCGDYPSMLEDLMRPKDDLPTGRGGSGLELDSKGYQGPYLETSDGLLPQSPFPADIRPDELKVNQELTSGAWLYIRDTGDVRSASKLKARDGTPYSTW